MNLVRLLGRSAGVRLLAPVLQKPLFASSAQQFATRLLSSAADQPAHINKFARPTSTKSTSSNNDSTTSTSDGSSNDRRRLRHEEERLFIIAQGDPDRFGSQQTPGAAVKNLAEAEMEDAGDRAEEAYLQDKPERRQRLSTKQYADMIKEHLRNRRVKEAIDVLEVRMLKEDRVKPENYIYNLLIGECGRLGYTRKSFNLFTRMKQRGLKVTGGTYTALFNACANTPWPQDGLLKAQHLRHLMLEKGYEPNASNYNAMIKAFGRGNDLPTAFELVDEMQTKRLPVDVQTFNFVLQACASDKELGFRHALLVWHKMLRRKQVPDVYSFNAMLRCVRDCGIGDLETMQQVIGEILVASRKEADELPQLEANEAAKVLEIGPRTSGEELASEPSVEYNLPTESTNDSPELTLVAAPPSAALQPTTDDTLNTPNLLSARPHLGRLVALAEVCRPEDRLLLLGGCAGFLREMAAAKAEPTIKTFTQLIDVLPPTNAAEKKLLAQLKRAQIPVDIDFFNMLIKKRCMRFDYEGAKEVMDLIRTAALQPDIVTYGVLALGCRTPADADELMQEMHGRGLRINIEILGAMLRQGCAANNFVYVLRIMQLVLGERIRPNEAFLMHLVRFRTRCYEFRLSEVPYAKTRKFREEFKHFLRELDAWRESMGLADLTLKEQIAVVREHPWEQFKYDQPEGMEELKNPKLRHKKKLQRHIQRVKVDQMRGDEDDVEGGRKMATRRLNGSPTKVLA